MPAVIFWTMKKYVLIAGSLLTFLVFLFLSAELMHIPFLTDNSIAKLTGRHLCWIGAALLMVDVLLPVPSSFVMITLGISYGVVQGTFWAFFGVMASAGFGFFLGRKAQPFVNRFVSEQERLRANAFIQRWGMLGIIITRPLPLLAETTALIAGTTNLSWKKLLLASACGNLPIAFLYAWTGATAKSINAGIWSFLLAIGAAGLFWAINYFAAMLNQSSSNN
jgi:uncharacterized membrane protein YdjX (TVP38/TMEM64 family)